MTKEMEMNFRVELPQSFKFYVRNVDGEAALTITDSGFYVRGKKVEQGPGEAQEVYLAFKAWLEKAKQ